MTLGAKPNQTVSTVDDASAVMLVGHGTRDPLGTAEFHQLGEILADLIAPVPVRACLLEFQEPTIRQGWDDLIASGARDIRVAPLLLFAAGHAKQDIPDEIADCRAASIGAGILPDDASFTSVFQSSPLSRHPAVVELLCQRIADSLSAHQVTAKTSHLVMVGRGSRDPCASADMRVLSELVRHRSGFRSVDVAFYAMAEPRLPEILDDVAKSLAGDRRTETRACQTVIVQPHLLFAGRLYQAIAAQVDQANQRHPNVNFVVSGYLGPDPLIAQAVWDRISGPGKSPT